ncbi:DUF4397 domain-containing protein [Paraglaciecola sp. 20A4]|uniref:DUF4397 domain-containing protein n=1 Tax=Paraglaciecola sp. 20A4 TaxID=2687288 RepID=UPI00140DB737|nr:DUF4397 domain-containing protein [Paraglaciecola sp. 20A4]
MFKKKFKTVFFNTIITALALNLCACDLSSSSDTDAKGYYQFVNLVPQSPAIEVVLEDESLDELAYGDASAIDYVSKGSYDLAFNQILPNSQNDEFTSSDSVNVSKNKISTYVMYGDSDAPSSITFQTDISDLFDDDFDDDYDAIIQFANLADLNTDIDVYLLAEGEDLLNKVADFTLPYSDDSDEVEVEKGVYKIIVTESGTDTILASSDSITISTGDAIIFAFTGYLVAGSDELINAIVEIETDGARLLTNEAQSANVRFTHGISNSNYLDVYLTGTDGDATLLASTLEFDTISDTFNIDIDDVDEGDTRYFYLVDNDTSEKIDTFTLNLQPSSRLLVLTAGDSASSITVNDNEEDLRVISTHAKLLINHSIDDIKSNAIEVVIVSDGGNPDSYTPQVELSYMSNEQYELESGDYDIYIYNASSGELIIETSLRGVDEGDVIDLIATDYAYGGSPYQLQTYFNY